MAPEAVATRAQCEALGEEFNQIGASLRAHGLRFSNHNHGHEIATVDGRTAFEWVLDAAEPRNLFAEVDVYWVQHAGKRPQDLFIDWDRARRSFTSRTVGWRPAM